jgi:hypothetical protein
VRSNNLEDLKTEFRQISDRARALVGPLNPGLLELRPKPQSWSVAECLAHLNVSADAYFPIWERELEQARKRLPAPARTPTVWISGGASCSGLWSLHQNSGFQHPRISSPWRALKPGRIFSVGPLFTVHYGRSISGNA